MRKIPPLLFTILIAFSLALVACGDDGAAPAESTVSPTLPLDPTAPPPVAGTTVDAITGTAFVEAVDVTVPGPDADEVQVSVQGNLNDGCTHIEAIDVTDVEENTFQVTVRTWRETDAICTQALVPFDETIAIDASELASGTYTVEVNGESATFDLPAVVEVTATATLLPSISLAPASGEIAPGTVIEVSGRDFPANTAVHIGAGPQDSEYEVLATTTASEEGTIAENVTLPDHASPGEMWVLVAEWDSQTVISEPYTLVASPTHEAPAATFQISPTSAAPGASLQLSGSGFPANSTLEIGAGPRNSEYDIFTSVPTDAQGNVDSTVLLPDFVEVGETWVLVADWDGNKAISNPVTITSSEVNVPVDGRFTRTQIYLIALEDGGRSGQEIGCGDSVVPVEVEIEPTVAPLRAALEALLAIDSEFYGQSGLYNALYRSDLEVEGIDIVNREAIIALTGELMLGGTCDNPRVDAQLTQTALQFSTVDAVTIRVNGTPLPELLSEQ